MNLAYHYPIVFWNAANLIVDSDALDWINYGNEDVTEDEDETKIREDEETELYDDDGNQVGTLDSRKQKVVDYGKIATAIGKFLSRDIRVLPPNINTSEFTFVPNATDNTITYGLRGIRRTSIGLIHELMEKRPYTSVSDCATRTSIQKVQMISLIKSGAFDSVENRPREEIMRDYILSVSEPKVKLTMQNMPMLIEQKLIPADMDFYRRLFNFNKYLSRLKDGEFYSLDTRALDFLETNFSLDDMTDETRITQKQWKKMYEAALAPWREYLEENQEGLLKQVNDRQFQEIWDKYAAGTISTWEMESIRFYYHDHELAKLQTRQYEIVDFNRLSETPVVEKTITSKKDSREFSLYRLFRIAGTVIDKNSLKHTITLSTTTGVVTVKVHRDMYSRFDRTISARAADGTKKVLEGSWFTSGTLLIVTGIRRGENFVPKVYKLSKWQYPFERIDSIDQYGYIKTTEERMEVPEQ